MSLYAPLKEIIERLRVASTLDEIGDIFRTAFDPSVKDRYTRKQFEATEIVDQELLIPPFMTKHLLGFMLCSLHENTQL